MADAHSRKRRQTAVADFPAADAELAEALDNHEGAGNYAAWILEFIEPHLGDEVLEVGAGHGTFTRLLAHKAKRLVASDLSARCAGILRQRFPDDASVEVLHGSIGAAASRGPFDAAILINVLEHIEDDDGALRELAGLLKPGGRVILWVPALPILYSHYDRKIGHHRRYRKAGLQQQLTRAGYEVRDIRYVNPVGALGWLVIARFLGKSPNQRASVEIFDRFFVPVLRRVERRSRPTVGQSVFAVAARPERFS